MSKRFQNRPSRVFRATFPDVRRPDFRTQEWRAGTARNAEELRPLFPSVLHAFVQAGRLEEVEGVTLVPERDDQPEESRSWANLVQAATHFAGRMGRQGVRAGDRVLIVLPTGFEFLITFFAVQMVGAIPVPTYPPAMLERAEQALDRLFHIARHASSAWCVTNRKLRPLLGELALKVDTLQDIITVEKLEAPRATSDFIARARSKEPAFIQYTSGSTGRPKGVLLSHGNLVANVHAIGQACQVNRHDVVASWLPLYHDMGLIGVVLFAAYWRLPLVLMAPTTFLMQPARWLWAIHRHRATLSPAPNFAYALCVRRVRPAQREGLDLSSWRFAFNGAEPVSLHTIQKFIEAFGPHGFSETSMLPVYGLAEASLAVAFPPPGRKVKSERVARDFLADGQAIPALGDDAVPLVGVGRAVPGHEIAVVDVDYNPLPDREVGHVVVKGPSVMQGYYLDEAATSEVLAGDWLWTGDLGYLADGELYITGRVKDLIIIRGRNFYAEDIERHVEALEGARGGGVVAFGLQDTDPSDKPAERLVLVVETKLTDADERVALVESIGRTVSTEVGLSVDEVVLVVPGTLPKTSSGKRQRSLTRQRYLKDELSIQRTGALDLVGVFARSGAGFVKAGARRLLNRKK